MKHALPLLLSCASLLAQVQPFEASAIRRAPKSRIDVLVEARLQQLGLAPSLPCADEVFVRRAFLDVTGTLPTLTETRQFLTDRRPRKHAALIDALLHRPEFVDYQTMQWCDRLRVKAEFPVNLWPNAVQCYERWLHDSLQQNVPYDRFVQDLLLSSGSNFRDGPVNFLRATAEKTPHGLAKVAALSFLGARSELWPQAVQDGLQRCFAKVAYKGTGEWKEEIVYFDDSLPIGPDGSRGPFEVVLPDGSRANVAADQDPRTAFTDWLLHDGRSWLAKVQCNRIWYSLLGRGIVHEPDDFRTDNPPVNPELLDFLADEFIRSGWDQRHVYRLILTSATYQRSSIPAVDDDRAAANFACYSIRRLEAEVLIDALCQLTGTREQYQSPIPEPFTFLPPQQRALHIGDGSITSSFLELFGRPPRDTGMCDERNNQPTGPQRLHLLNSSHVQKKLLNGGQLAQVLRNKRGRPMIELYMTILSRTPTAEELTAIEQYGKTGVANARQVAEDVAWALINSAEFLYRH